MAKKEKEVTKKDVSNMRRFRLWPIAKEKKNIVGRDGSKYKFGAYTFWQKNIQGKPYDPRNENILPVDARTAAKLAGKKDRFQEVTIDVQERLDAEAEAKEEEK